MGEEEESLEISARKIGEEKDSKGHIKKKNKKKEKYPQCKERKQRYYECIEHR